MQIEVYVCRECGNYFASSSFEGRDLNQIPNLSSAMQNTADPATWHRVVSHRGDCPNGHGPREKVQLDIPPSAFQSKPHAYA